ncbi:hypothetical protein D3C78_1982830 [compost metagenome]
MVVRQLEGGSHLPLILTMTYKATVPSPTKSKRQTVKKNGFTGARFTSQHRQARLERKIEPFNQDDIPDR